MCSKTGKYRLCFQGCTSFLSVCRLHLAHHYYSPTEVQAIVSMAVLACWCVCILHIIIILLQKCRQLFPWLCLPVSVLHLAPYNYYSPTQVCAIVSRAVLVCPLVCILYIIITHPQKYKLLFPWLHLPVGVSASFTTSLLLSHRSMCYCFHGCTCLSVCLHLAPHHYFSPTSSLLTGPHHRHLIWWGGGLPLFYLLNTRCSNNTYDQSKNCMT